MPPIGIPISARNEVRQMLADERRDIVTMLRTLSDTEWTAPSLCAGWQVRDVVAHLGLDAVRPLSIAIGIMRYRFSMVRFNDEVVGQAQNLASSELVDRLESTIGCGIGAALLPRVVLTDAVVHHQDILRPLGRHRRIPTDRLLSTLIYPDPSTFPSRLVRGLHFVATDVDWSSGEGPEVYGAGEALALAIAGRSTVLDELDGPGVTILRQRILTYPNASHHE
jgi:uncharacterized protein (TIGR03083 family)